MRIIYIVLTKLFLAHIGKMPNIHKGAKFKGKKHITIGDFFHAGKDFRIEVREKYREEELGFIPKVEIGNEVSFMKNCYISCINEIRIGDGCLFGDNVFITDNLHGLTTREQMEISPLKRLLVSKGPVIIDKNVWVGRNVCIMPNVHIGTGAVIGANSVVTHDVEEYTVVGGVPAKKIR